MARMDYEMWRSFAFGIMLLLWVVILAIRRYRDAALPQLDDLIGQVDWAQPLTLAEYRSLLETIPAPSEAQQQNFARFVSEADAWHRHLPLYPPGATFHFLIDPFAGSERVLTRDGRLHFIRREQRAFHYSLIPTREYRERFGYLAFSYFKRQWMVSRHTQGTFIPGDYLTAVADDSRRLRPLPPEIEEAGAVQLTAVVHRFSAQIVLWGRRMSPPLEAIGWPEESGGMLVPRRLIARSREVLDAAERNAEEMAELLEVTGECGSDLVDPVVHELLVPERERQQREMVAAMRRVTALIYG